MTTSSTPSIDEIFIRQAEFLCRHSEFLPGGVNALAGKLQRAAEAGKPLRIKLGLDPTRPDLHLGHTVVLRKLKAFQELGHHIILLIGDATALIGDPSGRSDTRPPLTNEEILVNAETYLSQADKVVNTAQAEVVRNSEWLGKLGFEDILKLSAKVTVAQMLVREDFSNRYKENKPISLHEFLYPLMQGYDSVALDADIELGGSDQRFNTLLGRDIQTAYGNKNPQSVLLMPIIEGTDGKVKMSKSYPDHCINLTDSPQEMYGKLMSIPDELIIRYLSLLTSCSDELVSQAKENMANGSLNPRNMKGELAKGIVADYHSREAAINAEEAFIKQFKNNELPEDMEVRELPANQHVHLPTLMAESGLAPSKAEARRLIQGGGVKLNAERITDLDYELNGDAGQEYVLQVGKRRFLKILFK